MWLRVFIPPEGLDLHPPANMHDAGNVVSFADIWL